MWEGFHEFALRAVDRIFVIALSHDDTATSVASFNDFFIGCLNGFLAPRAFWSSSRVPVSLASPTIRILRRPTTVPISLLKRPFLTKLSTLARTKSNFVFLVGSNSFNHFFKRKSLVNQVIDFSTIRSTSPPADKLSIT